MSAVGFIAFVTALAFPGLRNLTAPIVCQDGYTQSALVVTHWGRRFVSFDLYCLDGEGLPLATRPGIVWLAFTGELLALMVLLRLLWGIVAAMRPRMVE